MNSVTIIFPHQLFRHNPAVTAQRKVYLVEEWLFFKQYKFHKQKLLLHRAGMQYYKHYLEQQGLEVTYIGSQEKNSDIRSLLKHLAAHQVTSVHVTEVVDNWLQQRMAKVCRQHEIQLHTCQSPGFLNSLETVSAWLNGRKTYFQTDFYVWQRKQRRLLLEADGKPAGGKWTYDTENRVKFPKTAKAPEVPAAVLNPFILEAREYVSRFFPDNPGTVEPVFAGVVVTHDDAEHWLDMFIRDRFQDFGIYEDAMVRNEAILHHSVLTPMLNIGLLPPELVLNRVLAAAGPHKVPLNSLEGFVRQITGWREFIRVVYEREGGRQRTTNFWGFTRKIPDAFYDGTTGIEPVDVVIRRVLKTGYCHHIERLMVLGNFMLLCEFDPDEVYRWFMEMFIDAYDWVMVPNIYGMSQFADGGLMCTKPYISGSNYIMKMSNFEKGPWQTVWDGLFWRFMHRHRKFFLQNPRLGMLVGTFDKMPAEKREAHLNHAENFLKRLG